MINLQSKDDANVNFEIFSGVYRLYLEYKVITKNRIHKFGSKRRKYENYCHEII